MLNDMQRRRLWESMLGAEIRSNYFAELSGRYYARQRLATWAVLVLSSGAAASALYGGLPSALVVWLRVLLPLLAAALSLYSLVAQNQKSGIDSADLHSRWNALAKEYVQLWENVYSEDAAARLRNLDEQASELSKNGTAFPYHEKDMLRWEEHVVEHWKARVAA